MSSWKVKGIGGIFNVMGDQDPLVPMSSTKPEDTTRPFHFSLPLDFNKIYNKSFLLSRIPMSGLFYLLARSRPSEDLLNCPYPSQDLLCFLSKDSLLGWWRSRSWAKSVSSSIFTFSFFFLLFRSSGLHGP